MNKFLGIAGVIVILLIAGYFMFSIGDQNITTQEEKNNEVVNMEVTNAKFLINPSESVLGWSASKIIGQPHTGTVSIKSGEVEVEEGQIKAASLIVDMNTIKDNDGSAQLEKHLKSEDFFSVEEFPEATFSLSTLGENEIVGNLTIKGITNEVKVSGNVSLEGDRYIIESTFNIDRTLWDIRYGSGKFFEDLGDKTIKDEIEFDVKLVAEKA